MPPVVAGSDQVQHLTGAGEETCEFLAITQSMAHSQSCSAFMNCQPKGWSAADMPAAMHSLPASTHLGAKQESCMCQTKHRPHVYDGQVKIWRTCSRSLMGSSRRPSTSKFPSAFCFSCRGCGLEPCPAQHGWPDCSWLPQHDQLQMQCTEHGQAAAGGARTGRQPPADEVFGVPLTSARVGQQVCQLLPIQLHI